MARVWWGWEKIVVLTFRQHCREKLAPPQTTEITEGPVKQIHQVLSFPFLQSLRTKEFQGTSQGCSTCMPKQRIFEACYAICIVPGFLQMS